MRVPSLALSSSRVVAACRFFRSTSSTRGPNTSRVGPVWQENTKGLVQDAFRIVCRVKPNARVSKILCVGRDHLEVALAARPRDDEANEELVRIIGEVLRCHKQDVKIISGERSRIKHVRVSDSTLSQDIITQRFSASAL
ncbi:hypothetical protein DFJ73DRAFT_832850 [Zopfochytrium polystomum]|nr:hypothetical protein DFJ73DRAFT_832850 [Zopfochytrium polystomum]